MSLMNIDAKILHELIASSTLKESSIMTQWDLSQGGEGGLAYENQETLFTTCTARKTKLNHHLNQYRKKYMTNQYASCRKFSTS